MQVSLVGASVVAPLRAGRACIDMAARGAVLAGSSVASGGAERPRGLIKRTSGRLRREVYGSDRVTYGF